jgi:mono/diheme cytochrome c family protein
LALRRTLLIAPLLLALVGWAGSRSGSSPESSCGGCHAPHFVERGTCASCHRGDPLALRKENAHHRLLTGGAAEQGLVDSRAVAEGQRRVEQLACRRCHTVGGLGNRLATALDRTVWKRDQRDLAKSIGQPVENMPRFGLDARQTEAVIAFLLNSADPAVSETTYRVRFSATGSKVDSVFESRCGGCHRTLGSSGPLGMGSAGPNLSGLFTPFYPATAAAKRSWVPEGLGKWLENPRVMRPRAAMRPVRIVEGEREKLIADLSGSGRVVPGDPGRGEGCVPGSSQPRKTNRTER